MAKKGSGNSVMPGSEALAELLGNLAKAGASQYFFEIRRRCPGVMNHDKLWERWKYNLPAEDIDDIRDFCYSTGGNEWEYKLWLRDGSGEPVKQGSKKVGPFFLPQMSAPSASLLGGNVEDAGLQERQKELKRRKVEMDLQRAEVHLERERRRLDKIMNDEDDDDDDDGQANQWGMPPWMMQQYMMPPWMNPMMQGYGQQGQGQGQNQTVELAKAFAPVLTAVLTKGKEGNRDLDVFKVIVPLIADGRNKGFEPKDMLGIVGPLMSEMAKSSNEASKFLMEKMVDSDQFWKEKLIEAAKLGGADDDEVKKWKSILGLATEAVQNATKVVFGRPSIIKRKGSDDIDVPVVGKAKVPGLPAPGDKAKEGGSKVPENPAEDAKAVVDERVEAFLVAQEQEMLIGSDPVLMAEKLEELYMTLPLPLRHRVENGDTAATYDALGDFNALLVKRILDAVNKDETETLKLWCERFWQEIKHPSGEPGEDAGDDEGGGGGDGEGGGGEGGGKEGKIEAPSTEGGGGEI